MLRLLAYSMSSIRPTHTQNYVDSKSLHCFAKYTLYSILGKGCQQCCLEHAERRHTLLFWKRHAVYQSEEFSSSPAAYAGLCRWILWIPNLLPSYSRYESGRCTTIGADVSVLGKKDVQVSTNIIHSKIFMNGFWCANISIKYLLNYKFLEKVYLELVSTFYRLNDLQDKFQQTFWTKYLKDTLSCQRQ